MIRPPRFHCIFLVKHNITKQKQSKKIIWTVCQSKMGTVYYLVNINPCGINRNSFEYLLMQQGGEGKKQHVHAEKKSFFEAVFCLLQLKFSKRIWNNNPGKDLCIIYNRIRAVNAPSSSIFVTRWWEYVFCAIFRKCGRSSLCMDAFSSGLQYFRHV
mgnify:FL=1